MLSIGDTLFIKLKNSEDQDRYKSKIVDIKNQLIFIDYPISEKTGKHAFFLDGTAFEASFLSKKDNIIYSFESVIVGRKKENIPMMIINYPGKEKLFRIQRREFVRIETSVDVAVHPLNNEFKPFVTVTSDISGGGAAFILPPKHQFKVNMEILCYFVLPLSNGEYFYINTKSKIIRLIYGEMGNRDKASIQYIDLPESKIQQIIKFCFDRQLSDRKKGY
ncbi:flagellar brake protein [Calidifontibacillus erzurumensis]|uniref:flagellar brake protein n=1 Tax=Calidifontibacillus erzurumensis TaxID=2741433 RepID=UPI0035B4FD8F